MNMYSCESRLLLFRIVTVSMSVTYERTALSEQNPQRTTPVWLTPVIFGGLAILAVIVGYFFITGTDSTDEATDPAVDSQEGGVVDVVPQDENDQIDLSYVERRDAQDPLAIGPVDAPVTLVVFSDYQCPFCAAWSEETLPVMMDYVDDGQARIEWRDVNVYGADSERASKAAYAAGLQDQFWDYHAELYAGGEIRDPQGLSEEALVELADELGLDTEQFTTDMASEAVAEQISTNQALGHDIGAYSTPAFVVNGEPMIGAQPTDVFVDAMDAALAEAE